MNIVFKLLGFIGILAGLYVYTRLAHFFDIGQEFVPLNADTCKRLDTPEGPEDIIWIGNYALSMVDDRLDLFEFNNVNTTYMGDIILITPYPLSFRNLPIVDYPEEDNFHPHGMYLHNNKTLFVINHGFHKGGERIDILQLNFKPSIHIKYKRSITFPEKFMGVLSDLVAVSREEFFITQHLPCPDDKHHGRDHSLGNWIHNTFHHTFMESTHLHYCKDNFGVAECTEEVVSGGRLMGIGTDGEELFVNDAARKEVKRYSVGLKNERHLELIETIPLPRACHNIEYDPESGNFYLGSIGNMMKHNEYLSMAREAKSRRVDRYVKFPGGVVELVKNNATNSYHAREIIMQDGLLAGVSSAARKGDKILMGSWFDAALVRCDYPNNTAEHNHDI